MEEIIKVENIKKTFRDNLEILKGITIFSHSGPFFDRSEASKARGDLYETFQKIKIL